MRNRSQPSKGKGRSTKYGTPTSNLSTTRTHNYIPSTEQRTAVAGLLDSVKQLVLSSPHNRPPLLIAPRKQKIVKNTEEPRKFSNTQINLTGEAKRLLLRLANSIPDSELGEDGREDTPHITVKYGLHTNNPDDVRSVVSKFGPVSGTLTKLGAFYGEQSGKPYDVLFVEVESPDLHRLNSTIASQLDHTDTWPEYRPHATIAYLEAGLASKYVGSNRRLDIPFSADSIVFSGIDRVSSEVTINEDTSLHDFSTWVVTGKVDNSNPRGCNQYTGPECSHPRGELHGDTLTEVTNLSKKLTDDLRDFGYHPDTPLSHPLSSAFTRIQEYQQGTLVHKESHLEEIARKHSDIREHFEPVRKKLRELVGDYVVLYRGADEKGGIPGKFLSSYSPEKRVASRFLEGYDVNGNKIRKVLKRVEVPIEAIHIAMKTDNRPLEFMVENGKIPKEFAHNSSPTIKDLSSVVYDLIDDITKAQATAIARVVKQGYTNDKDVELISKELQRRLDFDKERADIIAQTELTRIGAADALVESGKQGKKKLRFDASADPCPQCQSMNGRLYTIAKAQNVIPVHPRCKCKWADPITDNVFCPTGEGGGVDPTCSTGQDKNSTNNLLQKIGSLSRVPDRPDDTRDHGFKVDLDPPYGRVNKYFDDAPTKKVKLDDLVATQVGVSLQSLKGKVESGVTDKPILVVKSGGKHYIHDGTHQATLMKLMGKNEIDAKIVEWDEVTNNVFCPTGKGGGRDPTCSPGGKSGAKTSIRTQFRLKQIKDVLDARQRRYYTGRGAGSGRTTDRTPNTSRRVGRETTQPSNTLPSGTRIDRNPPPSPEPARIAATAERVNNKIDRMSKVLRNRGQHEVASWLDQLKNHVNTVGVPAALEQLGGVGKKRSERVQYEGGWDKDAFDPKANHEDAKGYHLAAFCESYLNRHGITMSHQVEGDDRIKGQKLVSSLTPTQGGTTKNNPALGDFLPKDPQQFKDKLDESKALPGLERSEDLHKLMGKPVSNLTPEVHDQLDKTYGKDKWIVKAYGDEAAAGYGIYFPQRSRQLVEDAKNTIWASGAELAKYGFSHHRDARGIIVGIRHKDGNLYKFGTDKYENTIDGDVRHWGDKAHEASRSEKGAALPKGGKEFMAQPAFDVVGISEADRAAGVTIKYGQEGRVHVVTRNGRAEVVPHGTWLKGENLPVVFETPETRAMAKAAQEAIDKLPSSERNGQIYAPDLVKTTTGYKMVEANPANHTGSSGYLGNNPLIIDSYVSHIAGREPSHVRFIRSLLTERAK